MNRLVTLGIQTLIAGVTLASATTGCTTASQTARAGADATDHSTLQQLAEAVDLRQPFAGLKTLLGRPTVAPDSHRIGTAPEVTLPDSVSAYLQKRYPTPQVEPRHQGTGLLIGRDFKPGDYPMPRFLEKHTPAE